jgi:hypothetical protein
MSPPYSAIGDAAHGMFANAEADVSPARVAGFEDPAAGDIGEV